ncbi:MFS transporter [Sulfitobacter sp. CW3]|uniref:MFS transporter n=1 Tax=Sulfitobacter sp. CW3 TaxID=2861965 RepID=UPI001C5F7277|nr:MFS transporter [Sulfitobacter sp. CW3]MBW4963025.1 MFS transporter [Sulfitobacter sp. CW3]
MKTPFPLIFALWGAGLGSAAQYGKVSVVYDTLPEIYPEAGATLGFVVSLVGVVGIIFGVVAGLVVARVRYRRALIWALWVGAGMSAFQALLPGLPLLLASRVVEGASHLAIVVAAPTLIAQLSAPKDRGLTLSLWGTFFGVAFAVLSLFGRPLVAGFGVPALFLAHAIYMAVFAIYLSISLKRLPPEGPQPTLNLRQILRDHVTIYRSPSIGAPAAGWFFYTFCFVSILTVLPPYLAPELRNMILAAMPIVSIIVSMTLGVWLLGRIPAVQVVELGFGASALCLVWLWAAPGAPLACLALAAALGLVQGSSFATVPQLNGTASSQAQSNGAMAQMGNLGNTLGTPVIAAVLLGFGYAGMPIVAAIACLLGLCAHLILGRIRNRG